MRMGWMGYLRNGGGAGGVDARGNRMDDGGSASPEIILLDSSFGVVDGGSASPKILDSSSPDCGSSTM